MNENQCDKYYTYDIQEMELIEDTQYALGLLNVNNERQLNSNNSITGAKLLNGVKKTNSKEDILPTTFFRSIGGNVIVRIVGRIKKGLNYISPSKSSLITSLRVLPIRSA